MSKRISKEAIEKIINALIAVLSAIATTLTMNSCIGM